MTRPEFYAAFREARKINRFMNVFARKLPDPYICSLMDDVPLPAWRAACRYGDRLAFPPWRGPGGRYRSRVR